MASFDPAVNPKVWSYDGTHLRVMINGKWYPRFTTDAIQKGSRRGEQCKVETYRAQLLHYGLEDTSDYDTARERLQSETEKHVKPKLFR